MGVIDWVIIVVIGVWTLLASIRLIAMRKKGGCCSCQSSPQAGKCSACSGNCAACAKCGACSAPQRHTEKNGL